MKSPLSRFLVFLGCVSCLALSTAPAQASPPSAPRPRLSDVIHALGSDTLPAAWAGVWEFTEIDYDCVTDDSLSTSVDVDTLCTGDGIGPDDSEFKLDCIGSTSDTEVHVICSGSFPVEEIEDCVVTMSFQLDATRNGDTLEATTEFSQSYSVECGPFPGFCYHTVSTAVRIGPEPAECATSVEEMTWGRVKAAYR